MASSWMTREDDATNEAWESRSYSLDGQSVAPFGVYKRSTFPTLGEVRNKSIFKPDPRMPNRGWTPLV